MNGVIASVGQTRLCSAGAEESGSESVRQGDDQSCISRRHPPRRNRADLRIQ